MFPSCLPFRHHCSQEYLNHVTFAPPRGGRPDGAGWLPRRVRTDGRVNLSGRGVRERYESCTFEQWMLFKEHSLHTSDTMCLKEQHE